MKRSVSNKDNTFEQTAKKSRSSLASRTSAGKFHVEPMYDNVPSSHVDSDEDIHPNVLLERLLSQKVEKMVEKFCIESRPLRNVSGEKIIPTFDPDDHEINVKNWLAKIDQLGLVHKWDDYSKIVIMQTRLAGQAQLWFNRLDEYDFTWDRWKSLLMQAFPRSYEYADMLEELVSRKKLCTETITHYYHDKLAMCRRCRLDDAATLSCLIKGLPLELQNNAKAFKCDSPEEFYSGYLSAFENYRNTKKIETTNYSNPRIVKQDIEKRRTLDLPTALTSRSIPFTSRRMNCFRCNSTDHIVKNCPVPDRRVCKFCAAIGHDINRCPKIETLLKKGKEDMVTISIVQNLNDIYKKQIQVGDRTFYGYLDTGAQLNVVSLKMTNSLNYIVKATDAVLKGFTGDTVPAMGVINLTMTIDGLNFDTTAVVTHMKLPADVDILIGQPVINSKGISLVTTQKSATLKEDVMYETDLSDIKYKVISGSDVRISPQESCFVEVNIVGNTTDGDVCTTPRIHDFHNKHFAVPATVLTGSVGYIKVYNMGWENIFWQKGELITRAVPCDLINETTRRTEDVESTLIQADNIENGLQSIMIPNRRLQKEICINNITDPKAERTYPYLRNCKVANTPLSEIEMGDLSKPDQCQLFELLLQFKDCFAAGTKDLGRTNLSEMKIELTSETPVFHKPYRLAKNELDIVRAKVKDLLDAGIIKESESNYASPVILVKKKNGDSRLCVDYRALNSLTVKDRFPLPHIDDQLNKLSGKSFYTSLDLAQGYHQIPLATDSMKFTSFITPDGQWEYTRVPFGLANAPAVFQRTIYKLLGTLRYEEVLTFMDDLLLPSTSIENGLKILKQVLQLMREYNLKLNLQKCSFLKTEINYLGHVVSSAGIRPGDRKLDAVNSFPKPQNVHQVRQFIGLSSYFRKFIQNFAIIAKPLAALTKKNVKWIWGEQQEDSFQKLKSLLASKPVLALYNREYETEIHTDACKNGIAGILLQKQPKGELKPVMYFSRVTTKEEMIYHSFELETLAVVESLKRFKIYITGIHFKVITDCSAVRSTFTKRDLVPRIARWWLQIQDYDMEVIYRPGTNMRHVDALSRNPVSDVLIVTNPDDWFLSAQLQDDKLKSIHSQLLSQKPNSDVQNDYCIRDDRIYRKTLNGERLAVPKDARWRIVKMFHDDVGHVGLKRCDEAIKADYWFPRMTRFIKKYVNACLECLFKKGNYGKASGKIFPISKPDQPMHTVHIDHMGPFPKSSKGNQYVLAIIDSFTKFVAVKVTKSLRSTETIAALREVFAILGFPNRIVSDRGLSFTSRYFKAFCTSHKIHHTLNAVAVPRANGQVERLNRTLLDAIRTSAQEPTTWDSTIPEIVMGINHTVHDTTKFSPYELMFAHKKNLVPGMHGNSSEIDCDAKRKIANENIQKKQIYMETKCNEGRKEARKYKKGELVLWNNAFTISEKGINRKINNTYAGPYKITQVFKNDRYKLRSVKGMKGYKKFVAVVAADALRPYKSSINYGTESDSDNDIVDTEDLIDLLES